MQDQALEGGLRSVRALRFVQSLVTQRFCVTTATPAIITFPSGAVSTYFGQHGLLQRDVDDVHASIPLSHQKKLSLRADGDRIHHRV